jgi:hypothetical protein
VVLNQIVRRFARCSLHTRLVGDINHRATAAESPLHPPSVLRSPLRANLGSRGVTATSQFIVPLLTVSVCTAQGCLVSLQVVFRQLHEEALAAFPAPTIATHAADQPLAVMVDLDELVITLLASSKLASSPL